MSILLFKMPFLKSMREYKVNKSFFQRINSKADFHDFSVNTLRYQLILVTGGALNNRSTYRLLLDTATIVIINFDMPFHQFSSFWKICVVELIMRGIMDRRYSKQRFGHKPYNRLTTVILTNATVVLAPRWSHHKFQSLTDDY